jgi:hypothetical protein
MGLASPAVQYQQLTDNAALGRVTNPTLRICNTEINARWG